MLIGYESILKIKNEISRRMTTALVFCWDFYNGLITNRYRWGLSTRYRISPSPPSYVSLRANVFSILTKNLVFVRFLGIFLIYQDNEYKNDALLSAREAISLWILGTRKVGNMLAFTVLCFAVTVFGCTRY